MVKARAKTDVSANLSRAKRGTEERVQLDAARITLTGRIWYVMYGQIYVYIPNANFMLQGKHSTSRPEAKYPDTDQEEGQSNGSIAGQTKRSLRPTPSPQKESDTELEKRQRSGGIAGPSTSGGTSDKSTKTSVTTTKNTQADRNGGNGGKQKHKANYSSKDKSLADDSVSPLIHNQTIF
jgi:hypothetical protein